MPAATSRTSARRGFTLVELLIVVMLLAILSAVVVPTIRNQRREGVSSTLRSNLTQVQMVLEVEKQKLGTGAYPASLSPDWFVSGILPVHPDNMAGVQAVELVSVADEGHPADKLVHSGSAGAYWYNTANGVFRARVKEQASASETLAFYNEVNMCALASLSDTAGVAGAADEGPVGHGPLAPGAGTVGAAVPQVR